MTEFPSELKSSTRRTVEVFGNPENRPLWDSPGRGRFWPVRTTDGSSDPSTDDNLMNDLYLSRRLVKIGESVARLRSRVGIPDYKCEIQGKVASAESAWQNGTPRRGAAAKARFHRVLIEEQMP